MSKNPHLWRLALVTYGLVAITTVAAVAAYYYMARGQSEAPEAGSIQVGPVWVPVYPGALLHGRDTITHGRYVEATFHFRSNDPAERVLAFYRVRLNRGRIHIQRNAPGDGMIQARTDKGDASVEVTVLPSGEGSEGELKAAYKESAGR